MKRRLAVLTAVTLVVSLAGCSDDDKKPAAAPAPSQSADTSVESVGPTKPPLPESPATDPVGVPGAFQVAATGFGPYEIGATQAALSSDGLIGTVTDAGSGCATTTGSDLYQTAALTFAQGKLAQVKVAGASKAGTDQGVRIGATLADVKTAYPAGTPVTGTAGATGWSVPSGANTLIFEISADKVSALIAGTTATVTKVFSTGQGC